jgi:putative acetyltransferase
MSAIDIRDAIPGDTDTIGKIVTAAFGQNAEACLVDRIRANDEALIELVAIESVATELVPAEQGEVVGHVLVSPIRLDTRQGGRFAGIAPLSVRPDRQGQGIGSKLMHALIERCTAQGFEAIFLLGDPSYYARFGFVQSHIGNDYGATEAFMHLEIEPGVLAGIEDTAHYVDAFDDEGV